MPASYGGTQQRGTPERGTYEYREFAMPRDTSRDVARSVLTEYAEYGHWELARLRVYPDGRRRVWLRRRVMRVQRTA